MAASTAPAFATDLSNYLGLGCLVFPDNSTPTTTVQEPNEWTDTTDAPSVSTNDASIVPDLVKLLENFWIRLQFKRAEQWLIYRVWILFHDVARGAVNHQNRRLGLALGNVVHHLDINPKTWQGQYVPGAELRFDRWATQAEGNPSLWFLFNTLPSPHPSTAELSEKYAREALEDLLKGEVNGLRTRLFPYQRRAAGAMLLRESVEISDVDPRLERRESAASGSVFYYSPRDGEFLREPVFFERCRGGILSETMGLGKTVMCLALIQATKHQLPKVPIPYAMPDIRQSVASLAGMAVSAINRNSIPWKIEFERISATGVEMEGCTQRLKSCPPSYELPFEPVRWNRNTTIPRPEKMLLAATSLIVVPRNLVKQWQSEILKHVEDLRVLIMDDSKKVLPSPEELCTYDIVLFSRNRFELEINHGSDKDGRRIAKAPLSCRCEYVGATRNRNCTCLTEDMLYSSPLKRVHFKRLMVDEGHYASQSNSNAVLVVRNIITADHNWLVSGTPAKDLLGVEVDVSATDEFDTLLQQRRHFDDQLDRTGAIESLGAIAGKFLDIKPWSERENGAFKEYVYRHEGANTYSGFSSCFQQVLANMVIKTRPEDVELKLPPLHHKIVRLEPSFYDKMIANLFCLVLTANAVTSERVDQDYLFHKNSAKDRISLVNNLRQSTFWWTGFNEEDIAAVGKNSRAYLAKEDSNCTQEDRELLSTTLNLTETPILESEGWKAMSRCHELGVFVEDWPEDSAEHWDFASTTATPANSRRVLTGLSFLLDAQKFVNHRISEEEPGEGLAGLGIRSLALARHFAKTKAVVGSETDARDRENEKSTATGSGGATGSDAAGPNPEDHKMATKKKKNRPDQDDEANARRKSKKKAQRDSELAVLTKSGVPKSSLDGEPTLLKKRRASLPPKEDAAGKRRRSGANENHTEDPQKAARLLPGSPYARAKIVGTTSAKMSYLVSQILQHCPEEKILVFYEGDNIAYYIAQMLDLFHIKHEIYAKSLSAQQKSAYVAKFEEQQGDRVLLMDVKHASHGLNIPSASRIYFVNPVCRPDVEAQAIKRAHRIGQTRTVHVETLVLIGSLEEAMLERSKSMTKADHVHAKTLEDDGGIREIIQGARVMPVSDEERDGSLDGQMAALSAKEQLWGRPGWNGKAPGEDARIRKVRRFVDMTDHDSVGQVLDEEDDKEAREQKRQRLHDPSAYFKQEEAFFDTILAVE